MKKITFLGMLFIILAALVLPAFTAQAASPDVIKNWLITVTPKSDGSLIMKYGLDYCATTDFPDASLYIDAPKIDYTLTDGSGSIVKSFKQDGYHMYLFFDHVPKAGECFTAYYQFVQRGMATVSGENVGFVFQTTKLDFAKTENLAIAWKLPTDETLVKELNPDTGKTNGEAVWKFTNIEPNQTAKVSLVIGKAAYPDIPVEAPKENVAPENLQKDNQQKNSGPSFWGFLLIFVLVVAGLLLLAVVCTWLFSDTTTTDSSDDTYTPTYHHTSGTYYGGSSPSHSSHHDDSGDSSPSYSPPSSSHTPRLGGGDGGFSGRSSSCACVSAPSCVSMPSCVHSSCACACAGGGRAGCSAKTIWTITHGAFLRFIGKA